MSDESRNSSCTADSPSIEIQDPETPQAEVSDRKLLANRANAQKSTGPRSPEGKARSALNSLTHGLRAQLKPTALVLSNELPDYIQFFNDLRQNLDPQDVVQELLVERIALLAWKLRQNAQAQAHLLELTDRRGRQLIEAENYHKLRSHESNLARLSPEQREQYPKPRLRPVPEPQPAPNLLTELAESRPQVFSTLQRYETTTERAFYRALNEYRILHTPNQPDLHHHFHYHRHDPQSPSASPSPPPASLLTHQPPPITSPTPECAKLPSEPTEV